MSMDDLEVWFDKGVTDGLPVVPPTRERVERHLFETVRVPYRTLLPDAESGEGTNLRFTKGRLPGPEGLIPKFPSVEEIHVVVGRRHGRSLLHGGRGLARDQERLHPDSRTGREHSLTGAG